MQRKLIGLVGYAGAGKDAAAAGLVSVGWQRIAFADPLRKMLLAINPKIPSQVSASAHVAEFVAAVGWDTAKKHPEVRRLLQAIGTEAVRNIIGPDTWVELARRDILASDRAVVLTDVRFENEAAMIKSIGGVLIRVTRPGVGPVNDHISDSLVETLPCQFTILNGTTEAALKLTLQELARDRVQFARGLPGSKAAA
jgi:hypothetical protein